MNGKHTGRGNGQPGGAPAHDEATIGIGGLTSGEAGSTLTHETMAETGGSGGSGLTRNDAGIAGETLVPTDGLHRGEQATQPFDAHECHPTRSERDDPALMSHARGSLDTRSEQAGGYETGLGMPQTGANQTPADLEHDKDQNNPPWFHKSGQAQVH